MKKPLKQSAIIAAMLLALGARRVAVDSPPDGRLAADCPHLAQTTSPQPDRWRAPAW